MGLHPNKRMRLISTRNTKLNVLFRPNIYYNATSNPLAIWRPNKCNFKADSFPPSEPPKGKITLLSIHIKEIQFNVFSRLSTFYDSHRLLIKETEKKTTK